ncbi:hypothetical protein SPAN111604_03805 [Sphingomonas antarctica]
MKKITVAIIPQPVTRSVPARQETLAQSLRRTWRTWMTPGYKGGYSEA